jgi:hypothetical protein
MKTSVRWVLFEYKGRELVILSKPIKTKKLAEKRASQISRTRPKEDWHRRGSRANPVVKCLSATQFSSTFLSLPHFLHAILQVRAPLGATRIHVLGKQGSQTQT